MLDIKYIREHAAEVQENTKNRRVSVDIEELLRRDEARLDLLKDLEGKRMRRNEIAEAMKSAGETDRPSLIEEGKKLKEELSALETRYKELNAEANTLLMQVPNLTHPDAPVGADDSDNKELSRNQDPRELSFEAKDHVELGKALDILDFERGAKVTGAKFYFIKNKLVLLEQALTQWVLKEMVGEGYKPVITPDLAKNSVLEGIGFHPRGPETQVYSVEDSDMSLIGTAEIPLGGMHMDEVFDEDQLPLKYVGLSHCFRTEAGTYGRESYGLYRVHQFSKVELFIYAAPEQSDALHEELRRLEEMIFTKLGLTYRVVDICTGDLGGPAYRKYDLEAWMCGRGEGKGDWGEVTSTSNTKDYQARRLNIRLRRKDGSMEYAHTLNGTALALSRALIAVMEQNQNEDGSITVPEILQPYTGFEKID